MPGELQRFLPHTHQNIPFPVGDADISSPASYYFEKYVSERDIGLPHEQSVLESLNSHRYAKQANNASVTQ